MALPSFIDLHKKEEEGSDSPWLISFSDMMSLLLCFFVVLVGLSNLDLLKIERMTQHFAKPDRMTMKQLQEMIQEFINSENLQTDVSVELTSKGVEISFKDKFLFDLGKADLKPRILPILAKIANLLNYKEISKRKISVEGHTDSLPIKSEIYPSNWELSSARAANVVKFFTARGLDSRRFEAIGYADAQPIKPEIDRRSGEPENRRVVVVISPEFYLLKSKRKEVYAASAETVIPSPKQFAELTNKISTDEISVKTPEVTKLDKIIITPKPVIRNEKKKEMEKYFVSGQKYFLKKKYKEAIACWEKVLKLDPNHQLSKTNIERAKKALSKKITLK
ncbi:MAG: OmpA family protein [Elusimicrobiota bacterium]|nr:OmpA family protein [Elusimicrobiota bacterium]